MHYNGLHKHKLHLGPDFFMTLYIFFITFYQLMVDTWPGAEQTLDCVVMFLGNTGPVPLSCCSAVMNQPGTRNTKYNNENHATYFMHAWFLTIKYHE